MSLITGLNESGFRLTSMRGDPQDAGFRLVRTLEKVHATSADTIATALNTRRQYTNPKADRQTLSGTYIQTYLEPKVDQFDHVDIEQALTKVRSAIVDSEATLLGAEGDPNSAGYAIERGWLYFNPNTADTAAVALNTPDTYASPKADRQTYSGNFVNTYVRCRKQEDKTVTIVQRLTKGKRATDSADADLVATDGDPQQLGFRLTRVWRYVLPQAADGLATTLDGKKTYPSGVKADEQLYSGRYVNTSTRAEPQEDRTVSIRQVLTKVGTATDSASADFVSHRGGIGAVGTKYEREWKYIDPVAADGLTTTLRNISVYSSGFKADSQLYSGAYVNSRVDGIRADDQTITIRQTLTKGRATADSISAVFIGASGDPQYSGYSVQRGWRHFLPASADTAAVALNSKLVYDNGFRADSQAYTGKYIASGVRGELQDDRTITLLQTLTKVRTNKDSAEADLVRIEGEPQTAGSLITRAWHYVHPTSADTIYNVLKGISKYNTGIKADAQLYAGTYVVQAVRPEAQEDRTIRILQTVKRVMPVAGDTSLLNPLIAREKEIVHPFSEGRGTRWGIIFRYMNLDPATDTKCMALADTSLEKKMDAAKTYDLIDRKTEEQTDGTMTFFLLARKHERTSWSATKYQTPDRKMYVNRGRPREQRRLFWYGVKYSLHDSVVGDLIDANSDTGFRTVSVTWQEDDDLQAKDYVWTQVKTSTDTRNDTSIENQHGKETLKTQERRYAYENYKRDAIPAQPSTPTGYALAATQTRLNENGLIDKVIRFTKPTASNGVSSGTPTRSVIQARYDAGASRVLDYTGKSKDKLADRVHIRASDSVVRVWSTTPDTHYVTSHASYSDYGDGSARVTARQFRANDSAKFYWEEAQAGLGNYSAQIRRVWPYIRDTKAVVLMTPGSIATDSATYDGDTYLHLNVRRTIHFNGLSTVTQTLMIPNEKFSATGNSGGTFTPLDSLARIFWDRRGIVANQRIYHFVKEFTDTGNAYAFAYYSTSPVTPPGHIEGYVETVKKGRYRAHRFTYR